MEARTLGRATDGPVAKLINRRISSAITMFIVRKGLEVSPNQVSVVSFILAVTSFAGFLAGLPHLGGAMAQLSSIVDGVDGELARVKGLGSRRGAFLDAMLDRYADVLIALSASLYIAGRSPSPWMMVVSFLAISGSLLVSYTHLRAQHDLGVHPLLVKPQVAVATRDVRLFLIFVGGLLELIVCGALSYSMTIIALLSYAYSTFKFLQLTRLTGYP